MANTETSIIQRCKVVMIGIYRWKETKELQGNGEDYENLVDLFLDYTRSTSMAKYGVIKIYRRINVYIGLYNLLPVFNTKL